MRAIKDDDTRDFHLADFAGRKVIVRCEACGLRRQYDADAMLARIGDVRLPELRLRLAMSEGCARVHNTFHDRCGLSYDVDEMGMRE
tara:strand:- start:205 stop:465 length:261 start_codon:yes stop_codon:yes gene_type:complete